MNSSAVSAACGRVPLLSKGRKFSYDWGKEVLHDFLNLIEFTGKEMVGSLYPMKLLGFRQGIIEVRNLYDGAEFIASSLEDQLGLADLPEKTEVEGVHGNSQAHEGDDLRVGRSHRESHPRPEGEPHKANRQSGIMRGEIPERGANVLSLTVAASESSYTLSRPAEIKPQGGEAQLEGSLGRAIDHFVVHRAAIQRVGMANQRDVMGGDLRIPLDQRFQRSIGSRNEGAVDFRISPRKKRFRRHQPTAGLKLPADCQHQLIV